MTSGARKVITLFVRWYWSPWVAGVHCSHQKRPGELKRCPEAKTMPQSRYRDPKSGRHAALHLLCNRSDSFVSVPELRSSKSNYDLGFPS
jgi:hypothetical protein